MVYRLGVWWVKPIIRYRLFHVLLQIIITLNNGISAYVARLRNILRFFEVDGIVKGV